MRAAPAVQVVVAAEPFWRVGVSLLLALALAGSGAWVGLTLRWPMASAGATAAALGLIGIGLGWRGTGSAACVLRWDTQQWHLIRTADPDVAVVGSLSVMIDFGGWMLLRFAAQGTTAAVRWLPVSRRQGAATWHGLRTALFAGSPALDAAPIPRS